MSKEREVWSDNDRYFGPFTYARNPKGYRPLALILSANPSRVSAKCSLRFSVFGRTLILDLPAILKPAEYIEAGQLFSQGRAIGFNYTKGFLQIYYGRQGSDKHDSKLYATFLPLAQWRQIRISFFDDKNEHYWSEPPHTRLADYVAVKAACPRRLFTLNDYDGQVTEARTLICERELAFGQGRFKWLSVFTGRRILRTLDIEFNKETGPGKNSWKGGVISASIPMTLLESHEDALARYCEGHQMILVQAHEPKRQAEKGWNLSTDQIGA